ncbi:hypothetical protein [Brevibacillus fulvus]|uniref:Uncharacterized protein n=1 Tax=Brevibacillus fulvus TaxID=1125967 RepID=A0A939BVX5_9BACL|nr:hypothetical protein [Brevibacillus fulvus]MBM7591181.1 hypothetical protein [Brevibacillus fulvus]
MAKHDVSVSLLSVMRGPKPKAPGLRVVTVKTTEPSPITFVFEGSDKALDLELFEVPVDFYPLRIGDQLLAFPMVDKGVSQRWGLLQKINGGLVLGTYTGGKIIVPNFPKPIEGFKTPAHVTLIDGIQVGIVPYLEGTTIKYAITTKY